MSKLKEVLVVVFFRFNRLENAKDEVNFETFCVCPENGLSGKRKRNASFEMPALELFWGNPNGQFFLLSGGAARRDFNRYRLARHHYFFVGNQIEG